MAYITTEEVKAIREALKAKFGKKFKFSVSKRDHSQVCVAIVAGDTDFSDILGSKVPGDYGFGSCDINAYHITEDRYNAHAELFNDILTIIKTAPANVPGSKGWYDNSDIQTDYFDIAYYIDLSVGKWDRPYVNTGIKTPVYTVPQKEIPVQTHCGSAVVQ